MTDFLARLGARALGLDGAVRPAIAPLFLLGPPGPAAEKPLRSPDDPAPDDDTAWLDEPAAAVPPASLRPDATATIGRDLVPQRPGGTVSSEPDNGLGERETPRRRARSTATPLADEAPPAPASQDAPSRALAGPEATRPRDRVARREPIEAPPATAGPVSSMRFADGGPVSSTRLDDTGPVFAARLDDAGPVFATRLDDTAPVSPTHLANGAGRAPTSSRSRSGVGERSATASVPSVVRRAIVPAGATRDRRSDERSPTGDADHAVGRALSRLRSIGALPGPASGDSATERVVRISIGRIEVRAVSAPTPPAPVARPRDPAPSGLSLAEYLAKKRRGRA